MFRYELFQMKPLVSRNSFGILGKEMLYGNRTTVTIVAPFSDNREAVLHLAERCTLLQLSPAQLLDVATDFVAQAYLDT